MAALVLRRASPISRSAGPSSISFLRNHLFASSASSANPDKSPVMSYQNYVEIIEKEFQSYSNGLDLPSGFPFNLDTYFKSARMTRRYGKEMIHVRVNGNDPSIPVSVEIKTQDVRVLAQMSAKPDQLDIHRVTVRDWEDNMGDYKNYLQTKGIIMPGTVGILYQLLGLKP